MKKVLFHKGTLYVGEYPDDMPSGEDLRAALVSTVKELAASRIRETGLPWMVEREVSGGDPVPQPVKDECAAIRAWSDDRETLITAAADDAEMLAVDLSRPA